MRKVVKGVYRHFKGGLYYVIGVARNAENEGVDVVYHTLYKPNDLFVRSYADFFSERQNMFTLIKDSEENLTGQTKRFEEFNLKGKFDYKS